MPTATDLVTDLPADFEVFGQAVDTRLKALNPATTLGDITYASATANTNTRLPIGTNGQVLGVSGGVPAWVTDASGMTNPMTTTGDTIYSSSGSTPARLAIGSTGNVLTVAGGVPSWAAPASTDANWSLINAGGTNLTGADTITVSSISGANQLLVMVEGASTGTANGYIGIRLNTNTGSIYRANGSMIEVAAAYAASNFDVSQGLNTQIIIARMANNAGSVVSGGALFSGGNTTGFKSFVTQGGATISTSNNQRIYSQVGIVELAAAITSVSILSTANFDAGKVYVYKSI
jgi:hypothetical protein